MATSHVTRKTLHIIRQTVHVTFLHKKQAQGLDPTASRISKLFVSVGMTAVNLNSLRHKFNLKIFWRTTAAAMWENRTRFVSHTVRFSCAICAVVVLLLFVLGYKC